MQGRNLPEIGGMVALVIVCSAWTHSLFFADDPWIPLDYVNFMIHEAGHLIFMIGGEFMMMIGGSLFQLIVPMLFIGYFLLKGSFYSAGFTIFWLGSSTVNLARYIADARALLIPIFGGRHDWNWLLIELNPLEQDTLIASWVYLAGRLLLIIGLAVMIWGAVHKYKYQSRYRTIDYRQRG